MNSIYGSCHFPRRNHCHLLFHFWYSVTPLREIPIGTTRDTLPVGRTDRHYTFMTSLEVQRTQNGRILQSKGWTVLSIGCRYLTWHHFQHRQNNNRNRSVMASSHQCRFPSQAAYYRWMEFLRITEWVSHPKTGPSIGTGRFRYIEEYRYQTSIAGHWINAPIFIPVGLHS